VDSQQVSKSGKSWKNQDALDVLARSVLGARHMLNGHYYWFLFSLSSI
jgi:hypothetical protein